jgi:hypothetical protein
MKRRQKASGGTMSVERNKLLTQLEAFKAYDADTSDATLKELADLCRGLAMNPSVDSLTQREALELANEVAKLQGPPEQNPWSNQLQEQKRVARIWMAYLLSQEFQFVVKEADCN